MEDFTQRIPDLLERLTAKIRSITVEPAAKVLTILAASMVAGILVIFALVYFFVGLFRILGDLVDSMELAYAIVGGLFLLLGLLLWSRRTAKDTEETTS
ncbi:MAG: phage holin family protein [Actinobacteria bacterium]|nr:phage holin family protein [Actinomycetota bacterium]